jgi:hypothetical protein
MRKFIIHTSNKSTSFDLNGNTALAAEPTGLGNSFALSYKDSDKGKHLVNVTPDFKPIVLKIYFNADGTNGYANYKNLLTFLAACGTSPFLFEYADGVTDKYADVVLQSATKTETTEDGLFVETFTFERQTYWYEQIDSTFEIVHKDNAAVFPLQFPFGFAGVRFFDKVRVKNTFFADAPIVIRISGNIANDVQIYVKTVATQEVVAQIQLSVGNVDGTVIVIDPTTKKITTTTDGVTSNGYGLTDKTKQSFLYLPQGEYYIGSNMVITDDGQIDVSIKRYLLD